MVFVYPAGFGYAGYLFLYPAGYAGYAGYEFRGIYTST